MTQPTPSAVTRDSLEHLPLDSPVTVAVTRRALKGKEAELESEIFEIIRRAMRARGHLGANIFKTKQDGSTWIHVIFKFNSTKNMLTWEASPDCINHLKIIDSLSDGPPEMQFVEGLEAWFEIPDARQVDSPPNWKMAIITWLALYPSLIIYDQLEPVYLKEIYHLYARMVLNTIIIISALTWVLLPGLSRLLRKWLYPGLYQEKPPMLHLKQTKPDIKRPPE